MPRSDYSDEAVLLEHQEQHEISQLKLRLKKLNDEKRFHQINDHFLDYNLSAQKDVLEREKENISKDYRIADAYKSGFEWSVHVLMLVCFRDKREMN